TAAGSVTATRAASPPRAIAPLTSRSPRSTPGPESRATSPTAAAQATMIVLAAIGGGGLKAPRVGGLQVTRAASATPTTPSAIRPGDRRVTVQAGPSARASVVLTGRSSVEAGRRDPGRPGRGEGAQQRRDR